MQGTVLRAQSGFFWVQTDAGELECRLRGRLKKERQSSDIAVIGDIVEVTQVAPRIGAIEEVLPRRTKLARRAAGTKGVGKSSLLNAVQPGLALATGAISGTLGKGRHTTTVAELIPLDLPGGGYVADTPGIREIGLWRFPIAELAWCFREFRPFLGQCY